MFYVYLLESGTHRYVGYTNDLKKRLKEHNSGQNQSTKAFQPWTLVFYEAYIESSDAIRREKYLKTNPGRQTLSRMLRNYNSK